MTKRYEIQRVANIKAPNAADAVFYEVHTVVTLDGVEKRHRNTDVTFKTREEAEDWLARQAD